MCIKNTINCVGVSVIDNQHIRAILNIQQSPHAITTSYPWPKVKDLNYLMDLLVYLEKGSSKKYDPILPMMATLFYRDMIYLNSYSSPAQCSILLPRYTGSYVFITYFFCDLRLLLKILSLEAILEVSVSLLVSFRKLLRFYEKWPKESLEISISILIKM